MGLSLLAAMVATGEDFYPRLTLGLPELSQGFPVATAILGVLILGEVFKSIEDMIRRKTRQTQQPLKAMP